MFVKKLIPFAVAASFAMAGAAFAKTEFVTIGTGGITGVYYPTGGAIAKIVNAKKDQYGVRASVESTGGSKFNINAIDSKDLDFGIAQADTQYMAYNGKGAWEGKPVKKLRAVFALAPEAVTFVAAEDANIKSVKDVKGKTINLGDPGSGNRINSTDIFNAVGIVPGKDFRDEKLKPPTRPEFFRTDVLTDSSTPWAIRTATSRKQPPASAKSALSRLPKPKSLLCLRKLLITA